MIPPARQQAAAAAPKPAPKFTFDLSEIEKMAKDIEAEASRGGDSGSGK